MKHRTRFVLVKNAHDLDRVRVLRPDLLRATTALAATPHAALLLREYGVAGAVALGDLLSEGDRLACVHDAHRLSQTWHELLDEVGFEEARLAARLLRDDLLTFFIHATAAQRSVQTMSERAPGAEFWMFPGTRLPSMWQTEYECSHGLIEAAIRDVAARGLARIEYIKPQPYWHPGRIGRRLTKAVRPSSPAASARPDAVVSEGCGVAIGWADAIKMCRGKPVALAVGDDISLPSTFGYAPGLEAAGYAVLGASASDKPIAATRRVGSGAARPYFRIAAMPDRSVSPQSLDFVASRYHFERVRLAQVAGALRNPFLSFQYDHVFSELMPRVVRAHADITRVLDALEPSLVLVGSHGFNSHAAALAARARGVRSVLVPHGGALVLVHSTSADAVWAWGALPAGIIGESYGWSDGRVTPVGAPQLAHVRRGATDVAHRAEVRRRFGVPVDRRMLVVLTSLCTEGPWQPLDTRAFIDAWDRLLEWTARNSDVTVVVRPHPLMDMCVWYRAAAARRRLTNLRIAEDGTADEILCAADAAVVMEVTTTAALVAHAAGCPVLHVRGARWTAEGDAVWTEAAGLTVAREPAQIAPLLDGILKDGAARDACVRGGKRFLDAYVSDDAGLNERVRAAAAEALPATAAAHLR